MKMKKTLVGLLLVLGLVGFFVTNASAADANYVCTIDRIGGYTDGAMYVQLTANNGAFTATYFRIPDTRLNQIMAVLLTAASNGSTVYVRTDPGIAIQAQRVLKFVYLNVD